MDHLSPSRKSSPSPSSVTSVRLLIGLALVVIVGLFKVGSSMAGANDESIQEQVTSPSKRNKVVHTHQDSRSTESMSERPPTEAARSHDSRLHVARPEGAVAEALNVRDIGGGADPQQQSSPQPETEALRPRKKRPILIPRKIIPASLNRRPIIPVYADPEEPVRLNIIAPYMGRTLTGGPLSIVHFAIAAAKIGGFKVRWIQFEDNDDNLSEEDWAEVAVKYRLGGFTELIEIVVNVTEEDIPCNPRDQFVATIFYSPEIAFQAVRKLGYRNNFIYFIQDFEPLFMTPGEEFYWLALEGYIAPHFPIFSTAALANYFESNKYGLYSRCNKKAGECDAWGHVAQPTVKRHAALDPKNFPVGRKKKLVAYAREHIPRNAYEAMVSSLSRAVAKGVFGSNPKQDWEFIGMGAQNDELHCGLGGADIDMCLDNVAHMPEPAYLQLLSTADIGYSLMLSPHPSLPPFDFAAAGLITVTNTFEGKTVDMFAEISRNIIAKPPRIVDLVEGLREAVARVDDLEARKQHSELNWARSWNDDRCYGPSLFKKIREWQESPLGPAKYENTSISILTGSPVFEGGGKKQRSRPFWQNDRKQCSA